MTSTVVTQRSDENTPKTRISAVQLTTSKEVVNMLGPQALSRLGGLFSVWQARNAKLPQPQRMSFTDWVASRDDLTALNKRMDKEVTNLEAQLQQQSNTHKSFVGKLMRDMALKQDSLTARIASLEGAAQDEKAPVTLKNPRSQEEFNGVRDILYGFNKANNKRAKEGKELKWGESDRFSTISSEESLVAWLKTVNASACSLSVDTVDHFKVCVFRGKLVTLSKDYKDGIGIEAFWMPDSKYDGVCKQSACYKSREHRLGDPRHRYQLNGVKWTPQAPKKCSKKRKLTK